MYVQNVQFGEKFDIQHRHRGWRGVRGAALFEYKILFPKIKFSKHLNILASLYLSLVPL